MLGQVHASLVKDLLRKLVSFVRDCGFIRRDRREGGKREERGRESE